MSNVPAKRENLLLNLVCNIAAPALVLSKLSAPERLGPEVALVVALAFPLGYGVWDFNRRRAFNFVAGIGFVSTLLTGGFGLAKLDGMWFAIKEASVPAVIGMMVLLSTKSKRPLIREFIYNDQVIDVPKVDAALDERGAQDAFALLLARAGWWVTGSFFISAGLNFGLARWMLTAPAGTVEFNEQLGRMQWLSWPVIVLPSMAMMMAALWGLLNGIKRLTGMELEQVFHAPPPPAK
ncbi:MAG: MFS transporter [Verrucomicrobia bacterium]|nr:MFS transporter [Verrucomicrobiota bacterium]